MFDVAIWYLLHAMLVATTKVWYARGKLNMWRRSLGIFFFFERETLFKQHLRVSYILDVIQNPFIASGVATARYD